MADEDHEEFNDLFDDDDDAQQNNEQLEDEDAGYDPEQQLGPQDGEQELEDDMGGDGTAAAATAAAGDIDGLAEADLFGSDEEEAAGAAAPDEPTGAPITVSAPLLQRPPHGQLMLLKVPNIIKVDPQPYDPDAFDGGLEEVVEKGKRRLRPNDINVIRWRYRQNDDGSVSKESNARYVQWSDGTESIMLGDEVLTMERQQQPRANTYVHVVRYDAIQGLAHMKQVVQLKPASLNSKLHQRLKMTVHRATHRSDKVQMHLAARNPELEKAEAEKRAEELAKLRRSQARVAERSRVPKQRAPPTFNAAYIEQDDEDEPDYFAGGGRDAGDDDNYYRRRVDDDEAAARLQSAKRSTPPLASTRASKQARLQESEEEEEEEEEEAAEAAKAAAGLKVRRGAILDDDDD